MSSRRNFIQRSALGLAGSVAIPFLGKSSILQPMSASAANAVKLPVGVAGYTFAKFNPDQMITMMKKIGVTNLSLKEMHLALNSSDEDIKAAVAKYAAAGINIYAVGVVYMKTKEAVDLAFSYAKKVGVSLIVGVPSYDVLDYAEEKVKAYDIRLAIHNHGPKDPLYPSPKDVYDRIKDKDPRVGLCIDIGHTRRAGVLPEDVVKQYKKRLFDLHIKDVTAGVEEGKATEIGRGVIDFPALVKSLKRIGYTGVCSIEYEKDMTDPMVGIAESIGFFKGVLSAEA
jgi:inosose dehydratase